jgi:hypothetical protein
VVNTLLLCISQFVTTVDPGSLFETELAERHMNGVDVGKPRGPLAKSASLQTDAILRLSQAGQLRNPDRRVLLGEGSSDVLLAAYATFHNGLQTGDYVRFGRSQWEIPLPHKGWSYYQSTVPRCIHFGGRQGILRWEDGVGDISRSASAAIRGVGAWGHRGISISATGSLQATLYDGALFDENTVTLIPTTVGLLGPIWCLCCDPTYGEEVRKVNQTLKVRGDLLKVPFELERWTKVAQEKYPNGLPKPYSEDPTQWIFHGNPAPSKEPLQVAVARLLGYRWPAELDPGMELSEEAREWVKRSEALAVHADKDGIVCIPPVRGEMPAVDRLLKLMVAAFNGAPDNHWADDTLAQLLSQVGYADKTLEGWLRDGFFAQHCRLFRHRPFIWHVWDGLHDGFAALVNYHKLDAKLLETLIYTYLGDWISRQKQDIAAGVDGAEERLAGAETLKGRLEMILKGEAPYDIFVRWRPLEEQPIGWTPDLNDGVRLNIRPFMNVPDVGRRGAGVLRDRPNIDWGKDRGKDVESAPWFSVFKGERPNDHHLKLEAKLSARDGSGQPSRRNE